MGKSQPNPTQHNPTQPNTTQHKKKNYCRWALMCVIPNKRLELKSHCASFVLGRFRSSAKTRDTEIPARQAGNEPLCLGAVGKFKIRSKKHAVVTFSSKVVPDIKIGDRPAQKSARLKMQGTFGHSVQNAPYM